MCSQQEIKINQLKTEYNSIKEERNNEIEMYKHDVSSKLLAVKQSQISDQHFVYYSYFT